MVSLAHWLICRILPQSTVMEKIYWSCRNSFEGLKERLKRLEGRVFSLSGREERAPPFPVKKTFIPKPLEFYRIQILQILGKSNQNLILIFVIPLKLKESDSPES